MRIRLALEHRGAPLDRRPTGADGILEAVERRFARQQRRIRSAFGEVPSLGNRFGEGRLEVAGGRGHPALAQGGPTALDAPHSKRPDRQHHAEQQTRQRRSDA
jgi:hypothetical protein